jgi:hypothetical protein
MFSKSLDLSTRNRKFSCDLPLLTEWSHISLVRTFMGRTVVASEHKCLVFHLNNRLPAAVRQFFNIIAYHKRVLPRVLSITIISITININLFVLKLSSFAEKCVEWQYQSKVQSSKRAAQQYRSIFFLAKIRYIHLKVNRVFVFKCDRFSFGNYLFSQSLSWFIVQIMCRGCMWFLFFARGRWLEFWSGYKVQSKNETHCTYTCKPQNQLVLSDFWNIFKIGAHSENSDIFASTKHMYSRCFFFPSHFEITLQTRG